MNFEKKIKPHSQNKKGVISAFLLSIACFCVFAQNTSVTPSSLIMNSFDTTLISKELHASILFKFSVSPSGDAFDVEIVNRMKDNVDEEEVGGVIEAESVDVLDDDLERECIRLIEKADWSSMMDIEEEFLFYTISFNYGRVFAH